MRPAMLDEPAMRRLLGQRVGEELPEREERQEIGALVAKAQVRLVGRLLLCERPLARIGHRQRARDDQHLGRGTRPRRREQHAADARIDRQLRELAAERRERVLRVDRAELLEQLVAVGDRARRPARSRNGNASTAPRPSAAMRRITAASDVRRISGSVYSGRAAKSSSP